MSTAGRRDFLVQAQPKPASAAYQRVDRTLPPRAKPGCTGNPSPSESDPATQFAIHPVYLCTAAICVLCSTSLPFTFILRLLGPVFSQSLHLRRRRQPAIVPSEPNTNITSLFFSLGAVQRLPLVQVTFRFFSCALEPQLHCCTIVALVPPGLSYLRHPHPRDPRSSCFHTCGPTLVHRRTTHHEARVPNGVCVYRDYPVPITIT